MTGKRLHVRGPRVAAAVLALTAAGAMTDVAFTDAAAHAATRQVDGRSAPAADEGGGDVGTADSKRFTITNLTGDKLQLMQAGGSYEGKPEQLSWLLPGEQSNFELKYNLLKDSKGYLVYYKYDDQGRMIDNYGVQIALDGVKTLRPAAPP